MKRAVSSTVDRRPDQVTIVEFEPGICAIGTWLNVIVIVWWASATGSAVERLERVTVLLRELYPDKSSHVHFVKNRAGLPSAAARSAFVKIMKEHESHIANCAVVVGGSGFWASTMRSAITSMRVISPRSFEMRLHGTWREILEWLPSSHQYRTGVELKPQMLERVLYDAEHWTSAELEEASTR